MFIFPEKINYIVLEKLDLGFKKMSIVMLYMNIIEIKTKGRSNTFMKALNSMNKFTSDI